MMMMLVVMLLLFLMVLFRLLVVMVIIGIAVVTAAPLYNYLHFTAALCSQQSLLSAGLTCRSPLNPAPQALSYICVQPLFLQIGMIFFAVTS